MEQTVQGTDTDEGTELADLNDLALHDLVKLGSEQEGTVIHILIDTAISVDDPSTSHGVDIHDRHRETGTTDELSLELLPGEFGDDPVHARAESGRRNAHHIVTIIYVIHF
jgi:hypothetical protein